MDNRRRRRRSRGGPEGFPAPPTSSLSGNKAMYMACVVFLAFLMLQFNCRNCYAKQELMKITTSVEDIAKHLNTIQSNYKIMEDKLAKYSKEIPKLEEQISVMQALAEVIEVNRFGWNPRTHAALPFVDVKLNNLKPSRKIPIKNATKLNTYQNVKKNNTNRI